MTNYSKGEWKADVRTGCVAVYTREKVNCLMGAEIWAIYYKGGRQITKEVVSQKITEEDIANAHLIAAAPDMYEACQKVLLLLKEQYKIVIGSYPDYGTWGELELLRQTLAKARGEQ